MPPPIGGGALLELRGKNFGAPETTVHYGLEKHFFGPVLLCVPLHGAIVHLIGLNQGRL